MVSKRKRPSMADLYGTLYGADDAATAAAFYAIQGQLLSGSASRVPQSMAYPSSSQSSAATSVSAPPPKRARKAKSTPSLSTAKGAKGAVEPPEKRRAIFKKKCPQNILERVHRVMDQRFFMVDRRRRTGLDGELELREEFDVLGSTGNVYTVVIDQLPSCTCPDSMKGNHCKHILFIFLKVLQVSQASGHWYQKALLTSELRDIFSSAPVAPNAIPVAPTRVREEYARVTGRTLSSSQASSSSATKGKNVIAVVDLTSDNEDDVLPKATGKKKTKEKTQNNRKMPAEDDDCPICYETLHAVNEKLMEWCETCGKPVHNECFGMWKNTVRSKGNDLTCVYCRSKWVMPSAAASSSTAAGSRASNAGGRGGVTVSEGYLNLSGVAGVSPVRDTSSYYQGPRRGSRHYGYHDYW